jgi:hypothetical protein
VSKTHFSSKKIELNARPVTLPKAAGVTWCQCQELTATSDVGGNLVPWVIMHSFKVFKVHGKQPLGQGRIVNKRLY